MKNQEGYIQLVVVLLQILIIVVIGTGWIKNIIKLSNCDFEAPYKAEIIHTIGIIPPVGAVTGWINIKEGENVPK